MTDYEILDIALASGFKLKEQPDGSWSLNPYVWQFAKAIEERSTQARQPEIDALKHLNRNYSKVIDDQHKEIATLKADSDKAWQAAMGLGDGVQALADNAALKAEVERLRKDAERLDFLDSNKRFQMGWSASVAPVGNVKITSIIMGGSPIRDAIDASMMETGKRFSPQAIMETLNDDAVLGKYIVTVPPAVPAPADEPVLYQMRHANLPTWVNCSKAVADTFAARNEGHEIRPLYTHPASDELVKAAEWYVECYEKHTPEMTDDAYKQLRAALDKVKT